MKFKINVLICTCIVCVFLAPCLRAQVEQEDIEELKKKAPKIFVDCDFCDIDHIRSPPLWKTSGISGSSAPVCAVFLTQKNRVNTIPYTVPFLRTGQPRSGRSTLPSPPATTKAISSSKMRLFPPHPRAGVSAA